MEKTIKNKKISLTLKQLGKFVSIGLCSGVITMLILPLLMPGNIVMMFVVGNLLGLCLGAATQVWIIFRTNKNHWRVLGFNTMYMLWWISFSTIMTMLIVKWGWNLDLTIYDALFNGDATAAVIPKGWFWAMVLAEGLIDLVCGFCWAKFVSNKPQQIDTTANKKV